MNEKRKLILDLALDCFFIVLLCLAMVVHSGFLFIFSFLLSVVYSNSKRFFQKKPKIKKHERDLTTPEVIAWFAIGFSAIYIFSYAAIKGLLNHTAFIMPMCVIFLAIRLLYFSKAVTALQTSKPTSN